MDLKERRVKFREGLNPLYLPIYDSLCLSLSPYWAPYYGLRTLEEQTALYAIGRTIHIEGKVVTDAPAGFSAHNYGCASDWVLWDVGNRPVWMKPEDSRWNEYRGAIEKAKGRWGGYFHSIDCPHNELNLTVQWYAVGAVFQAQGREAAEEYFKEKMVA